MKVYTITYRIGHDINARTHSVRVYGKDKGHALWNFYTAGACVPVDTHVLAIKDNHEN